MYFAAWWKTLQVKFTHPMKTREKMKRTICTRNKTLCRLAAKMKDLEDGGEAAEGSDEEGGEVGCNWIEKH